MKKQKDSEKISREMEPAKIRSSSSFHQEESCNLNPFFRERGSPCSTKLPTLPLRWLCTSWLFMCLIAPAVQCARCAADKPLLWSSDFRPNSISGILQITWQGGINKLLNAILYHFLPWFLAYKILDSCCKNCCPHLISCTERSPVAAELMKLCCRNSWNCPAS